MSAVTSLYIVSHLLVVVGGKNIINAVAGVIMYPYMTLSRRDAAKEERTNGSNHAHSFLNLLHDMGIMDIVAPEHQGDENINGNHISGNGDGCIERLVYVFILILYLFLFY